MLRSLMSLAGGLLLCAAASAQVQNHVSPYKIGFDGWVLNPIVQTVGTNACVVHSFVALSKADSTYGENIVAVWYIREGNGTWSTKSWSTSDKGEAIKSVKVQMGLPDSEDALWDDGITTAVLAQKATSIPEDYQKGLLASDPYAQVLTDPFEREFVVEILADVGYRAASVLLDKAATTGCVDPLLTKLAGEVEKSNCSAGGAVSSAFF